MRINKKATRVLRMEIKQGYFGVVIISLDGKTERSDINKIIAGCNRSPKQKSQFNILMKSCARMLKCEIHPNNTTLTYDVETNVAIAPDGKLWFNTDETPMIIITEQCEPRNFNAKINA